MQLLLSLSKADYYATVIDRNRGNQKELFKIMDHLLCRKTESNPPDELPGIFASFFIEKIAAIRRNLSSCVYLPPSVVFFSSFFLPGV